MARASPPSSVMVWPLSQVLPGARMKAAMLPMSSPVPRRRVGLSRRRRSAESSLPSILGRRRWLAPWVGITPGAIALNRMRLGPHSTASDLVMASSPALDMAEGTTKGEPVSTQVTTMDSTEPGSPSAIQRRPTAWVT
ncbi:hypothetical protein GY14_21435 [Delftia tsuruhatensis]|nr:hypothetical protein GY14_21435 [Delftia tsuruhatensis]